MSVESRLKMSISRTGKPSNHLGHSHSQESRQKMSHSHVGKPSGMAGKSHSMDTRKYLSELKRGIPKTENHRLAAQHATRIAMHRPEVRKKHLDALKNSRWLGQMVDKGQIELLEKWNRLGFSFQPNYPLVVGSRLFYLDGYDPTKNVVMEFDSKYHSRSLQKNKDLERQKVIVETLKPVRFWRYNVSTKTITNVGEK